MNIIISQLPESAWQQYKSIRLKAVESDPQAFGCTLKEELMRSDAEWKHFLNNMWFAITEDNKLVSMIGLLQDTGDKNKHRAALISFWVDPTYRGHEIGKKLIETIQKIAYEKNISKLYLQVTTTQSAAIKLYTLFGFEAIGTFKKHSKNEDRNLFFDQLLMEKIFS